MAQKGGVFRTIDLLPAPLLAAATRRHVRAHPTHHHRQPAASAAPAKSILHLREAFSSQSEGRAGCKDGAITDRTPSTRRLQVKSQRHFVSLWFAFVPSLSWQMLAFHQEMAPGTLCPVSPSTAWCRRVRTQHATRHRRPDRIAPAHRPVQTLFLC